MKAAAPLVVLALVGALLLGCGGSSSEETGSAPGAPGRAKSSTAPAGAAAVRCPAAGARAAGLRATGAGCAEARRVMTGWLRQHDCRPRPGSSRSSCPVGSYRCLATATDRGWSVGCAEPGRSIGFSFRRG
ncbi:MAG TPA: hypothetical protein VF504_04845 [Solirubrobacterales bacterium]